MAITHRHTPSWGSGSEILSTTVDKTTTSGGEQNYSLALGTVTDQAVDLEWAQAKLLSIYIEVSVECTLEINSSSAATDTITLSPTVPFQWIKGSGVPYPFTGTAGAVTAGYITTTAATDVEIRALVDL